MRRSRKPFGRWHALPTDLLCTVFQFLPGPESWPRLALACRQWRAAADRPEAVFSVAVKSFHQLDHLVVRPLAKCERFECGFATERFWSNFRRRQPANWGLRDLGICLTRCDGNALKTSHLQHLESLRVINRCNCHDGCEPFGPFPSSLTHLHISEYRRIDHLASLHRLTSLELRQVACFRLSEPLDDMLSPLRHLPLRRLVLSWDLCRTGSSVSEHWLSTLPASLTHLEIRWLHSIRGLGRLTALRELHLTLAYFVNKGQPGLSELLQLQNLVTLSLSAQAALHLDGEAILRALPSSLRDLSLSLENVRGQAGTPASPPLRRLSLNGCPIGDHGLREWIWSLPLEELSMPSHRFSSIAPVPRGSALAVHLAVLTVPLLYDLDLLRGLELLRELKFTPRGPYANEWNRTPWPWRLHGQVQVDLWDAGDIAVRDLWALRHAAGVRFDSADLAVPVMRAIRVVARLERRSTLALLLLYFLSVGIWLLLLKLASGGTARS